MLVTRWCLWLKIGDNFVILMPDFRCWWYLLNVGARWWCKKMNVGNQNGRNRHQHILSPRSVTNIDITYKIFFNLTKSNSKFPTSTKCFQHYLSWIYIIWTISRQDFWFKKMESFLKWGIFERFENLAFLNFNPDKVIFVPSSLPLSLLVFMNAHDGKTCIWVCYCNQTTLIISFDPPRSV